jgi:transcriptional regulator with XRE-family HTH domain
MERKGMTQAQLADFLTVHESFISLYFAGHRYFGRRTAQRISKLTGIPWYKL